MERAENERLCKELANVAIGQAVEVRNGTGLVESSEADTEQLEAARSSPAADASSEELADPSAEERPGQRRDMERRLLANVYCDPTRRTVTLLLDDVTANTVIYAVRQLAADAEAHAREVRLVGADLPPDSYGASNRHAIALRHERIARRLRLLDYNYRDITATVGLPIRRLRSNEW